MDAVSTVNISIKKINPDYKPKQLEVIESILDGKDILAVLPKGYGKSLTYQLLPSVCKQLEDQPDTPIIVVILPTKALIKEQMAEVNKLREALGIRPTCRLEDVKIDHEEDSDWEDSDDDEDERGKFNILFSTPDVWLKRTGRELLSSHFLRSNVVCIVVDDAHKIACESQETRKVLKETFGKIGDIRSYCDYSVPVLVLSENTKNNLVELAVSTSCLRSRSLNFIYICKERKNVRLSVKKLPKKSVKCFNWLLKLLFERGENCPKVLVYCRTTEVVGWLFHKFTVQLGLKAYKDQTKDVKKFLIGMYHECSHDSNKEKCLKALTSDDCVPRVIFATSVLSSEIVTKDLSYVCHFGTPHTLVDYCQQIGMTGHGDEPDCHSILYSFPDVSSVFSDFSGVDKKMKAYVSSSDKQCLRTKLYTPFNDETSTIVSLQPSHTCCSYCTKTCTCESASDHDGYTFENEVEFPPKKAREPVRTCTESDAEYVEDSLVAYHRECCPEPCMVPASIVSGVTASLIMEVVEHLPFIDSEKYVRRNLTVVHDKLARKILLIVDERFGDVETMSSPEPTPPRKIVESEKEEEKYVFSDCEDDGDCDYDDEYDDDGSGDDGDDNS